MRMSNMSIVDSLAQEIQQHIAYRGDSDTVHLLWQGYLLAYLVGGRLKFGEFTALYGTLKDVGREEFTELYLRLGGEKPGDIRRLIHAKATNNK